jgi:uncharacterized protein YjbI with pentapeptide repeats
MLPAFVRRRRDPLLRVFAAILALCMLGSGFYHRPATAHADSTCNFTLEGTYFPCPPPTLLDYHLMQQSGGLYSASPAQQQSLQNLEQQAVANTVQDHGLSSADTTAVQSWGRDDAEAELWNSLGTAIATQPISRTTDQQNVVDWLTAVQQRENVQAAQDAGLEYVKWAGLDQTYYQYLLSSGANVSTLESFLSGTPVNYNNGGSFTNYKVSTGGYCVYQSPAHDTKNVYGDNIFSSSDAADQDCFVPCQNSSGCPPPTPSYDNFVEWGATDATDTDFSAPDYATAARNIGIGVGIGLAAGVAVPGVILAANAAVAGLIAIGAVGVLPAGSGGLAGIIGLTSAFTAGAVAGSVAALVLFVVLAVVVAVFYSINLFNANSLPGQLATLITNAPTSASKPDLSAILGDSSKAPALYGLFVGATLPTPSNTTCDNSLTTSIIGTTPAPCLNAPPIPSATSTDATFSIQQQGTTTTGDANSISWKDTEQNTTTTGRLNGNWFIDQVTNAAGTTSTVQTLRMQYTDWNGTERTAYVVDFPTDGYKFVGFTTPGPSNPPVNWKTCVSDGTCFYSSSIDYVGTDGKNYSATIVPPPVPVVAPTWSANPLEGSPMTFNAHGFSPAGSTLTYQWQFQVPGSNCVSGCSNFTAPISGNPVSYTWPTSGNLQVQLTATDTQNRSTVDTFVVSVGDVPPTLTLAPACPNTPACDTHTVALGSTTSLQGTITHAGSADTESATVNWGDGAVDVDQYGGSVIQVNGNPLTLTAPSGTALALSATHTYANPGSYTVTITVSDQGGGTASVTTTERAQHITTVTWPAPQAITYGTALDATQLDASAGSTGGANVPGTFAYSVDGQPVTPNEVLAAGPHTLSVQFTPSDTALYTTPAVTTVPLTVNQALLLITASSPSLIYNGTVPPITPSYSPFANNESASSLTAKPACGSIAPSNGTVGTYLTSCLGAVDPNYAISYTLGTLTISQAATTATLATSAASTLFGQPVTFTATIAVTSPGAGNPGGTVEFKDGATDIGGCAGQTVSAATGTATCTTSSLSATTHSITAIYSGDTNFSGSNALAVTQTVSKAATSLTLSASPSPSTRGQSATFTALVAVTAPGAGTPSGTVTFKDGTTTLGTGQLSVVGGNDQATFSTSGLAVGPHTITAGYGGDTSFLSGTSAALTQYVNTNLSGYPKLPGGAYNLSNANLSGGSFVGMSLVDASLTGSNLTNAVFTGADLTGANLSNSNFMGSTNFTNTILKNANLSNSNFKSANFSGANLSGATLANSTLKGATGLKTATLTSVIWSNTTCPDSTVSNNDGGTCVGHI